MEKIEVHNDRWWQEYVGKGLVGQINKKLEDSGGSRNLILHCIIL